jgi:predicted alpha/beta superfamily hydrolase
MKKTLRIYITLCFLLIAFDSFSQNSTEIKSDTLTKNIASEYFESERKVKIFIPKNYTTKKKYPVIYTLDGYGLFHITSSYAHYLMEYDIIPQSIVVSIYHNNRNYETNPNYGNDINVPVIDFLEGSEKLKNHLIKEVKPLIEEEFSTSKYSVLIGHSNTATFVNEMISEKENNFNSFIAITPDLLSDQIIFLKEYLNNNKSKISYFVSSGLKDDTFRLETGKKLDTVFKNINGNFKGLFKSYDAGHLDLVPKSLNDALMFSFSEYRNFSNVHNLILEPDFSIKKFINNIIENQSETYGIESELNEDDFFYLSDIVAKSKNKTLVKEILDISEQNSFYPKDHLYSDKAQSYEYAGFYEDALMNWKLQIENGYHENTFYFERPFQLLTQNLNRPKEGIELLEMAIKKYPKGELTFRYLIAETILENQLSKSKGLKNINFCITNFRTNKKFTLEDAEELKSRLAKK